MESTMRDEEKSNLGVMPITVGGATGSIFGFAETTIKGVRQQ